MLFVYRRGASNSSRGDESGLGAPAGVPVRVAPTERDADRAGAAETL